ERIFCWKAKFRSTVIRTSYWVAAARKRAPFFIPWYPASVTGDFVRSQVFLEVPRDAFIKQQFHCGRVMIPLRAQELLRPARESRWETDPENGRPCCHSQDIQKGGLWARGFPRRRACHSSSQGLFQRGLWQS